MLYEYWQIILFITEIYSALLVANYIIRVIAKYVIHNTNTWCTLIHSDNKISYV
jgi:hypothetical protein